MARLTNVSIVRIKKGGKRFEVGSCGIRLRRGCAEMPRRCWDTAELWHTTAIQSSISAAMVTVSCQTRGLIQDSVGLD